MDERTIFLGALDEEDPASRRAYLDAACAGNPALRQRIEALLRSHEQIETFLDGPALEQITRDDQALPILRSSSEPSTFGRLDQQSPFSAVAYSPDGRFLTSGD